MNKLSLLKVRYLRCRCSLTLKTGTIAYSWVDRVIWFNFTPYPSCIRSILNDSVSAQHRPRERKGCLSVVIKSTVAPSGPKCCSWHMEGQVFIYEAPCPFKSEHFNVQIALCWRILPQAVLYTFKQHKAPTFPLPLLLRHSIKEKYYYR